MKNWFKILLPLVIVLSGLVLAQKIVANKKNQPVKSPYNSSVSGIKKENVTKIIIKDSKGEITLNKNGQDWQIGGKKADNSKIDQVFAIILDQSNNYELVSQNPDRALEFGLATGSATVKNLTLNDENKILLSVRVGSDSYPGTFIQVEGKPEIYLTSQSLNSLISSDPQNYLEFPKPAK